MLNNMHSIMREYYSLLLLTAYYLSLTEKCTLKQYIDQLPRGRSRLTVVVHVEEGEGLVTREPGAGRCRSKTNPRCGRSQASAFENRSRPRVMYGGRSRSKMPTHNY